MRRSAPIIESPLDPVRRSWPESPVFHRAWLKSGDHLTWLQRVGFGLLSLMFFGLGLITDALLVGTILDEDPAAVESLLLICLAALATLIFLVPGMLGLPNVRRFPRDSKP